MLTPRLPRTAKHSKSEVSVLLANYKSLMNSRLILQYSLLALSVVWAKQQKRFINRQLFNVGSKYSLRGLKSLETTGTNILDETGIRHNCSPNQRISSYESGRT